MCGAAELLTAHDEQEEQLTTVEEESRSSGESWSDMRVLRKALFESIHMVAAAHIPGAHASTQHMC